MAPKPAHVLGKGTRGKPGSKPKAAPAPAAPREPAETVAWDSASHARPKEKARGAPLEPTQPSESPTFPLSWVEGIRKEFLAEKPG